MDSEALYLSTLPVDLCEIMLKDSAHIQMFGSRVEKQKGKEIQQHIKGVCSLYDVDAAVNVMGSYLEAAATNKL